MSDAILFEDSFSATGLNHQKYDRVGRITALSVNDEVELTLDINTEIYPFHADDKFQLSLASTLALDGKKDDGRSWRDVSKGESTLADHFDYVMYGKIYKFDEGEGNDIEVYISFGGLLLYLKGPYKRLTTLRGDYVYLLMRKS